MTNRYANLGAEIIRGSELFAALYIEVTDDGSVSREVGLNVQGEVVYKFPWPGSSFRGTCDLATFDLGDSPNDISPKEFDRLYGSLWTRTWRRRQFGPGKVRPSSNAFAIVSQGLPEPPVVRLPAGPRGADLGQEGWRAEATRSRGSHGAVVVPDGPRPLAQRAHYRERPCFGRPVPPGSPVDLGICPSAPGGTAQ